MKCPVCQTVNADNADLCQQCHSDLEIYRQLDSIDSTLSNKKRAVILLSTLLGFIVLGGSAAFVQLNKAPNLEPQEQTEALDVVEKLGPDNIISINLKKKKLAKSIPALFDQVYYMKSVVRENDTVSRALITNHTIIDFAKDRSGVLDKMEKPDLGAIAQKIFEI